MPNPVYKMFSREEELELFRRWREDGDRAAYESLVMSQMAFARRLAGKWAFIARQRNARTGRIDHNVFEEMLSATYEGVLLAVSKFDTTLGFRLTTFVSWTVRTCVAKRDRGGPIKLPVSQKQVQNSGYWDAYVRALTPKSLQHRDGDGLNQFDLASEDDGQQVVDDAEWIARVNIGMAQLTSREQEVLSRRFWERETLKEVGESLGISRQRVRQTEVDAINQLRIIIQQPQKSER
jgi:RNA polymerase sigma factor (sigma-70 family)